MENKKDKARTTPADEQWIRAIIKTIESFVCSKELLEKNSTLTMEDDEIEEAKRFVEERELV